MSNDNLIICLIVLFDPFFINMNEAQTLPRYGGKIHNHLVNTHEVENLVLVQSKWEY